MIALLLLGACRHHVAQLAFTSTRDGNPDIYTTTLNWNDTNRVTTNTLPDEYPSISARGTIVFVRGARGSRDLWLADKRGERQLTSDLGDEATPHWTPDGHAIYYTHTIGTRSQIMRIHPDGTNRQRISREEHSDAYPSLSPDGTTLVFHSYRDGGGRTALYLSDAEGGNQRRLTDASARDFEASFSLDSRSVVFSSNRAGGSFQIYRITLGTGALQQLTFTTGDCWSPKFLDTTSIVFNCGSPPRLFTIDMNRPGQRLLGDSTFANYGASVLPSR